MFQNEDLDLSKLPVNFLNMHRERKEGVYKGDACSNNKHAGCPPEEGWVKVNFDANVAHDFTRGHGVIFRNTEGIVLAARVNG